MSDRAADAVRPAEPPSRSPLEPPDPIPSATRPGVARRAVDRVVRALRVRPWPIHPIVFGAYFVLFLLSQNLDEVTALEALPYVAAAAVGAALVTLVAALVFGDARRGGLVAGAFVVAFFAYGHVVEATAEVRVPALVHQVGWATVLLASIVLAIRIRGRLAPLTRGLNVAAIVLLAVALSQIVPYEVGRRPVVVGGGAIPDVDGQASQRRDVFYLVFDRHANDATLERAFGIRSGFTEQLEAAGFVVLQHSYANYMMTNLSLASSLNLTYLDELTERYGRDTEDVRPSFAMLQEHAVGRFLKEQGYRYIHTGSAYGPTDQNVLADSNPRKTQDTDFGRALFDTTILPGIQRRFGGTGRRSDRERLYDIAQWQWETLERVRDEPGPKFVLSHFLLPHPPYIFDTDGTYVSEATEATRTEAENYRRQLEYTDGRIMDFLRPLVALPEAQRPIIIIQADEGPFPPRYTKLSQRLDWTTTTSDEIEQKFGILNAWLLPEGGPVPYPAMTPVNAFRFLFSEYFDADVPLLPDRVYVSKHRLRPYDFIEITDRLIHGPELRAGPPADASS